MTALWTPSPELIADSNISHFIKFANDRYGMSLQNDVELYDWSVTEIEKFWSSLWDFCKIKGEKGSRTLVDGNKMPGAQFFPDARINYAENLLNGGQKDDDIVMHFWGEDKVKRNITYRQLSEQVSKFQQFLQDKGVKQGDRVAAFMPNTPDTIIAMLAATSLGAIWACASPDFGTQGVLDRFGQVEPKVLIATDGYYYYGKWIDCRSKLEEVIPQLPSLQSLVMVSYHPDRKPEPVQNSDIWNDIMEKYQAKDIYFNRLPFNHPLFIMFSSGTTGKPKCIVHGAGGTLLQQVKEHILHCNEKPGDNIFYFTTIGWMMWNWQIAALACGMTLSLYDGSPFTIDPYILFKYADEVGINLFGVSAKYIDSLRKQNNSPKENHSLASVRTITSTGSPLVPEAFDYVYSHIKKDVHLASISGGTDIVSCFMLGYPTRPVYRGELQGAGFGLAVDVYTEEGKQAPIGEKGELVCTKPFVAMPVAFWNDENGEKYHNAYFARFPNIWHHGDYVEKTSHHGFIIHGRSDATLNPNGVRIGTAEIYRQVEQLPEIIESIVVGQKWDDDERVVLFVKMKPGENLTEELMAKIRKKIREGASPRHVPAKIIAIMDIPRTKNNKISEIAVRDTINGKQVANTESLANPEVLTHYQNLPELQQN